MPNDPALFTTCPGCLQENVGVVPDWNHRNGANEMLGRYRLSRHKVILKSKDRSVPYCMNSRNEVPKELIFEREKSEAS